MIGGFGNSGFGDTGFGGFDSFFTMFKFMGIFQLLMFVLVFGIIGFVLFKGLTQWNKNNKSPQLTVNATVVSKREEFSRRRSSSSHMHHTSTWYYVTFEVESGDRMEFIVNGPEFGTLIEGDKGKLTFQGTRYLGFERIRNNY